MSEPIATTTNTFWPMVVEQTNRGERSYDLPSDSEGRIVFVVGVVEDDMAASCVCSCSTTRLKTPTRSSMYLNSGRRGDQPARSTTPCSSLPSIAMCIAEPPGIIAALRRTGDALCASQRVSWYTNPLADSRSGRDIERQPRHHQDQAERALCQTQKRLWADRKRSIAIFRQYRSQSNSA